MGGNLKEMLYVMVFILKIIGYILLAALGLLILLLLAVLFVPIRYRLTAEHGEKLKAEGRVSWLLHILHARISHLEGILHIRVRLFGFILYDNLRPRKPKSKKAVRNKSSLRDSGHRKKPNASHKENPNSNENIAALKKKPDTVVDVHEIDKKKVVLPDPFKNSEAKKAGEENSIQEGSGKEKSIEDRAAEDKVAEEKSKEGKSALDMAAEEKYIEHKSVDEKSREDKSREDKSAIDMAAEKKYIEHKSVDEKSGEDKSDEGLGDKEDTWYGRIFRKLRKLKEKIISFFRELKNKILHMFVTMISIKNKIGLIHDFIQDKINREGFHVTYQSLKKLLKHILPTKLRSRIVFGTGDPCSTGQALGIMSILYSFYGDKVQITPDFENKRFEGKHLARGRIRLITILIIVIKLILDKRFKQLKTNFQILKEAL